MTVKCPPVSRVRAMAVLAILLLGWSPAAFRAGVVAAERDPPRIISDRGLRQALETPAAVTWSGVPTRRALQNLAAAHHFDLLIDRRVDPDAPLDVTVSGTPAGGVLDEIAAARGADWTAVDGLVFFGPRAAAHRLRTQLAVAAESFDGAPRAVQTSLAAVAADRWDDFAEPRRLLERLAEAADISITGVEQLPHDLWAAAELPPLTVLDRMNLVAAQYDYLVRFDAAGKGLVVEPVTEPMTIVRRYPAGTSAETVLRRWTELLPEAEIRREGSELLVRATIEEHEQLTARPTARPQRPTPPTEQRHSLKVASARRGQVLAAVAQNFELDVAISRDLPAGAADPLDERITLDVKEATLDELLDAILASPQLMHQRDGKQLQVEVRKK